MNEEIQELRSTPVDYLSLVLGGISWVLALPLRGAARTVIYIRRRRYDPEKILCPACGYKGERSSNHRSCTITFTLISGKEKAAIKHTCLRCSAPFFSGLLYPADKWIGSTIQTEMSRLKEVTAKKEL